MRLEYGLTSNFLAVVGILTVVVLTPSLPKANSGDTLRQFVNSRGIRVAISSYEAENRLIAPQVGFSRNSFTTRAS